MCKTMKKSERFADKFINFTEKSKKDIIKYLDMLLEKEEGFFSENKRMRYMHGREFASVTYSISYLVDKGEIFKETVAFSIYTDEVIDFFIVEKRYGKDKEIFSKKDTYKLCKYITELVLSEIKKHDNPLAINIK